jgi:hypothetical protein
VSTVHWGSYYINGDYVLRLCRCLQYLDLHLDYGSLTFGGWTGQLATMFYTTAMMESDNDLTDLLRLLAKRRGVGATDPRDLIYSLLGVARNARDIQPDYSKPINDVFTSVTRNIIQTRRDLKVLGRVLEPSTQLPTWVPDWRTRPYDWAFSFLTASLYNATGSSRVSLEQLGEQNKLHLQGIRIDSIEIFTEAVGYKEWKNVVRHASSSFRTRDGWDITYSHTAEPLEVAFVRTCSADKQWIEGHGWERWMGEPFNYRNERVSKFDAMKDQPSDPSTEHRQFFITKNHRIGLAPLHAQKGDVVCLLLGGEVPLLLREAGDEYEFVGECYVHGLMNGEGLIEARRRAQPNSNSSDVSWLETVHRGPRSFNTEEFIIH